MLPTALLRAVSGLWFVSGLGSQQYVPDTTLHGLFPLMYQDADPTPGALIQEEDTPPSPPTEEGVFMEGA